MATRRQLLTGSACALGTVVLGGASLTACSSKPATARNGRPHKEFGVAVDPWRVGDWAKAVGAKPTTVMEFESWDRNRGLDTHFQAARDQGLKSFVVTWEPWATVDPSLGKKAEFTIQPEFSNEAIAAGRLDSYIRMFAGSVKKSGLTVYIRYAHEMEGDWYPWSHDPDAYVRGWRRVVNQFKAVGADNARFIFSPGVDLYEMDSTAWLNHVRQYWPGTAYVDYVGITMISFGGQKTYEIREFVPRINLLHSSFAKDVFLAEVNSAIEERVRFFTDLRTWLATPEADSVKAVILSQQASRGQAVLGDTVGDLSWQVTDDSETKPVIKALINDIT